MKPYILILLISTIAMLSDFVSRGDRPGPSTVERGGRLAPVRTVARMRAGRRSS